MKRITEPPQKIYKLDPGRKLGYLMLASIPLFTVILIVAVLLNINIATISLQKWILIGITLLVTVFLGWICLLHIFIYRLVISSDKIESTTVFKKTTLYFKEIEWFDLILFRPSRRSLPIQLPNMYGFWMVIIWWKKKIPLNEEYENIHILRKWVIKNFKNMTDISPKDFEDNLV